MMLLEFEAPCANTHLVNATRENMSWNSLSLLILRFRVVSRHLSCKYLWFGGFHGLFVRNYSNTGAEYSSDVITAGEYYLSDLIVQSNGRYRTPNDESNTRCYFAGASTSETLRQLLKCLLTAVYWKSEDERWYDPRQRNRTLHWRWNVNNRSVEPSGFSLGENNK